MNTKQNTGNESKTQGGFPFGYNKTIRETEHKDASQKSDLTIIHDAKIITPQPYGVFALCKIIEHLQNN
jgi:hypothetical protein